MTRPCSPLAEARKRLLATLIEARGGTFALSPSSYEQLADAGLPRAEADAAVDALVDAGRATLEIEGRRVIVQLLEGGGE